MNPDVLLRIFIRESIRDASTPKHLITEKNPFYGILMDPKAVSNELATPEGAKKVASIIDSMHANGSLSHVNRYASKYSVPREFLLGVIIDEQLRAFGKSQIEDSDIWDDIASYFSPSSVSVGLAQIEPTTVMGLLKGGWRPASYGSELNSIMVLMKTAEMGDLPMGKSNLDSSIYEKISSLLKTNQQASIETTAKLLSDHRDMWNRVKGLEDWAKSYDAWETYAFMHSVGSTPAITSGMTSPEKREKIGKSRLPAGGERGEGIGTAARQAKDYLNTLD